MPRNEPWATLVDDVEREGWYSQVIATGAGVGALVKEGFGLLGAVVYMDGGNGFAVYDGLDATGQPIIIVPNSPTAASVSTGELWARFFKGLYVVPAQATTTVLVTYR